LRCALQVNPYRYIQAHGKSDSWGSEDAYNAAVIAALVESKVKVIAVTDHHRIAESVSLVKEAESAGIKVFPGFEYYTSDSVHLLCLFQPKMTTPAIQDKLTLLGVDRDPKPHGKRTVAEVLDQFHDWRDFAICIAPHVCSKSGLLAHLPSGAGRMNAWMHPHLLAVGLAGPADDCPPEFIPILRNQNADYRRARLPAFLSVNDVSCAEDVEKPAATTWIKMSTYTIEALRQAFLDPDSRISRERPALPHAHIAGIEWQGGFFDGLRLRFSPGLNTAIGGRGAGKSTLLEGIRSVFGLEAIGEEARANHKSIRQNNLGAGARVRLHLHVTHPTKKNFIVERSGLNPPQVFAAEEPGKPLATPPSELLRGVQIFGQHEISEIARDRLKRTRLLKRFVADSSELDEKKRELRSKLQRSREQIISAMRSRRELAEKVARLPILEEKLRRYEEAKVKDQLREKRVLQREKEVLSTLDERLETASEAATALNDFFPLDLTFADAEALKEMPHHALLAKAMSILLPLNASAGEAMKKIATATREAQAKAAALRTEWAVFEAQANETYATTLRELQKQGIKGEEFIQLEEDYAKTVRLKKEADRQDVLLKQLRGQRESILVEWNRIKAEEFAALQRAAKKLNKRLLHVRIDPHMSPDRSPLAELIDSLPGTTKPTTDRLKELDELSLAALVSACRKGEEALREEFHLPPGGARILADAGDDVWMQIEELDQQHGTNVMLNVTPGDTEETWKAIDDLSTGQKATAILLLLLAENEVPLLIDQPEDDLDNRFIMDVIVPMMQTAKNRRQFIFATHNANIPVLGDADLVIAVEGLRDDRGEVVASSLGSIDQPAVQEMIQRLLEGGRDAFERRREKYGLND